MKKVIQVPIHLRCRLLYTNPVCILTTIQLNTSSQSSLIPSLSSLSFSSSPLSSSSSSSSPSPTLPPPPSSEYLNQMKLNDNNNITEGTPKNQENMLDLKEMTIHEGGEEEEQQQQQQQIEGNMMVISWLTAIDSKNKFICSMNKKRHSAHNLRLFEKKPMNRCFVLNVPIQGMEDVLCQIGHCSGSQVNKFQKFKPFITPCEPGGWKGRQIVYASSIQNEEKPSICNRKRKGKKKKLKTVEEHQSNTEIEYALNEKSLSVKDETRHDQRNRNCIAIEECVAHMVCSVERIEQTNDHFILFCSIEDAYVLEEYWKMGKLFAPSDPSTVKPYLTFLGSQQFAYTVT